MMQTLYVPCFSNVDPLPVARAALKSLAGHERIGLATTVQHMHRLGAIKALLEKNKKKVFLAGQVLGCNYPAVLGLEDKVDAFLYVGSGMFHPLGFFRETSKPVFIANPYSGEVVRVSEKERALWKGRQRARMARAAAASVYGVLVSTKTGQFNVRAAFELKRRLEAAGKKAYIFAGEELSPDRLLGFRVDAWVNTACPRIVEDVYDRPVLNPEELEVLL